MLVKETMVLRLGDGRLICAYCFAEEYPDEPEPIYGWLSGVCGFCDNDDD